MTPEGKATSSRNAQTHGLTPTKVQPNEVVTFDQFLASYTKLYDPQTDIERSLVRRCADYQIRIDRALSAEAAFVGECVNRLMQENDGITFDEGLGLLFLDKRYAPRMSLLLRYQSQATRGYNQSKKELQQLIAERRQAEELAQAVAEEAETKEVMRNGFVWQKRLATPNGSGGHRRKRPDPNVITKVGQAVSPANSEPHRSLTIPLTTGRCAAGPSIRGQSKVLSFQLRKPPSQKVPDRY